MAEKESLMDIKEKIKFFYHSIKDLYPVKKIILYGSYAKGNANNNSDIDIGVVIDMENYKNKIGVTADLFHYSSKIDTRIEPICIPLTDFYNHEYASILGEIIRTGIEII